MYLDIMLVYLDIVSVLCLLDMMILHVHPSTTYIDEDQESLVSFSFTIFPKPAMNVWYESPEASDHNSLCRPGPALCRLRHHIPRIQCLRCLAKSANVMEIYDAWEPGSETQKYVRNILLIHFCVRNEGGVRISTVNCSTAAPLVSSRFAVERRSFYTIHKLIYLYLTIVYL